MSDTIVVMNQGYIQQIGTPEKIYNEPENAFVADFIGDSNIIDSIMIKDELVEILGAKFACVDKGFRQQPPRRRGHPPGRRGSGQTRRRHAGRRGDTSDFQKAFIMKWKSLQTVSNGWSTPPIWFPVGTRVGIRVDPYDIQIMNKPSSEDEEAVGINE